LAKADPQSVGPLIDLPRLLEFWFQKLDKSALATTAKPVIDGKEVEIPFTYPAAVYLPRYSEGFPVVLVRSVGA
jgi:hypothetical protein